MITNKYFITTRKIPTYIKYLLAKKQSGGRLPSGYQELEYIESTDETHQTIQYIDTGVKGDLKTKVEIDFEPTGQYFQPFGADSGSYVKKFCIYSKGTYVGTNFRAGIYQDIYTGDATELKRYYVVMSYDEGLFIDNVFKYQFRYGQEFETDRTLPVFCYNGNGRNEPMKMKLYSLKIYKENILVRDFIPALRKSDSKPRTL